MNEVVNAIIERRSVRKYKPDPISAEDRDEIIKAGLYAASSKNTQPWHLTVVENPGTIAALTEQAKAAILRAGVKKYEGLAKSPKYTVNYGNAPIFIIVAADPALSSCPAEDCSQVLANMFLAAHSLGIGSCWINQLCPIADEPGFRAFITELGVPPECKIYGAACFGYADGAHPHAPPRREGTVNIVR